MGEETFMPDNQEKAAVGMEPCVEYVGFDTADEPVDESGKSAAAVIVGSVAGMFATAAVTYFLGSYKPVYDSAFKNLVTKVGLGLVASSLGNIVTQDVEKQVYDTIEAVQKVKEAISDAGQNQRL